MRAGALTHDFSSWGFGRRWVWVLGREGVREAKGPGRRKAVAKSRYPQQTAQLQLWPGHAVLTELQSDCPQIKIKQWRDGLFLLLGVWVRRTQKAFLGWLSKKTSKSFKCCPHSYHIRALTRPCKTRIWLSLVAFPWLAGPAVHFIYLKAEINLRSYFTQRLPAICVPWTPLAS